MCSREEYLKRYLDQGTENKGSKKKSNPKKSNKRESRFKIVDGDLDIKRLDMVYDDIVDECGEEAPVVADIVDERPEYIKISEIYDSSRWKKVDNHTTDDSTTTVKSPTVTGLKEAKVVEQSFSRNSKLQSSNNMRSPSRENRNISNCESGSDLSPDRLTGIHERVGHSRYPHLRLDSDSDISPPRKKPLTSTSKTNAEPSLKNRQWDHDVSDRGSRIKDSVHRKSHTKRFDSSQKIRQASSFRLDIDSDGDLSPQRVTTYSNRCEATRTQEKSDFNRKVNCEIQNSGSDSSYEYCPRKKTKVSDTVHEDSQNRKDLLSNDKNMKVKDRSRYDSDSDVSPPRRNRNCKPHSPETKLNYETRKHDYVSSKLPNSPDHMSWKSDKSNKHDHKKKYEMENGRRNPTLTLSGMRAGLQDASTIRKEMQDLKSREDRLINEIGDEVSGRTAETVLRDRSTGKRRNLKEERLKRKEEEKIIAEQQEKYMEWGKGIKQKEEREKKLNEDCYEMTKPLARYRDDDDLERNLKEQLHSDDPMLQYMLKKKAKEQPNNLNVPTYDGPSPPNRFGIKPGYRWDGVDRSNGFEKKCFGKQNDRKAFDEEAHKWSIQNM